MRTTMECLRFRATNDDLTNAWTVWHGDPKDFAVAIAGFDGSQAKMAATEFAAMLNGAASDLRRALKTGKL